MASILEGMPCRISGKRFDAATQKYIDNGYQYATFLDFSTDHEEYENGPGMFPVGIVLLENGQLASVPIQSIEILSGEEEDDGNGHDETMGDTKDPNDTVHI